MNHCIEIADARAEHERKADRLPPLAPPEPDHMPPDEIAGAGLLGLIVLIALIGIGGWIAAIWFYLT